MRSGPDMIIEVVPSAMLRALVALAHAVAAAAILLSAIPSWLAVALLVLVGASLAVSRRTQMPERLKLRADGRLEVLSGDGEDEPLEIDAQSLIWPFVVVVRFRQNGRMRSVVAMRDSLEAQDFRQLRVWLRWRASRPS